VAYYIHTASASHLNPKWTFSSSTTGSFNMACFKQAAGANTDTTWMGRPQRPMANFFPTIVKVP
jgi:hypothetical protein